MSRPLRMHIDEAALRHNLRRARQAAGDSRLMAVVKANGYGHGLVRVARVLAPDVDAFGVASLDEARSLREAGIRRPLCLLEGVFAPEELAALGPLGLQAVFHQDIQLDWLDGFSGGTPFDAWIKIDTGMHRLGFPPQRLPAVLRRLRAHPAVGEIRLMSHLACADDRSDPATAAQLAAFRACLADTGLEGSLANSAGLLGWPGARLDWVRPGLMLYGASPFAGETGAQQGLRPVMQLDSALIAVSRQPAGARIGYGGSWTCPEDMPVGVVAVGYGDGYPRHAPTGTPVLLDGAELPLIGRVSMDMICVDLRARPGARVGDPVRLWGEGLPVERVAAAAGTLAYELLCHVGPRRLEGEAVRACSGGDSVRRAE